MQATTKCSILGRLILVPGFQSFRPGRQLQKEQSHGHLAASALVYPALQKNKQKIFHQILHRFDIRHPEKQISRPVILPAETVHQKAPQGGLLLADGGKRGGEKNPAGQ